MIEIHRVIETEATEEFWNIRAAKYDKLYWTKDQSYIDAIIELGELEPHHLALDVGTGTGTIARAIRPHVKHVVAVDPSSAMLAQGKWEDVSIIKWNILRRPHIPPGFCPHGISSHNG
jgi:ubiquinone/menaquinone biosynthesis C-methylase UbiE